MNTDQIALGALWYLAFLFSTTCHEASHALAAKIGGDPTAALGGQVTLNPLPHIRREPFGTVVVPILSYALAGWMLGWASAPFDPNWQRRYPRRAAWMALAGPGANLGLVLLSAAALRAGVALGQFRAPASASFVRIAEPVATSGATVFLATLLSILFALNLLLFTFNLIPVPPLDGYSAIPLLLGESAGGRFLEWARRYGMIGLLLAWLVFDKIFRYVFLIAINLLYPGAGYG